MARATPRARPCATRRAARPLQAPDRLGRGDPAAVGGRGPISAPRPGLVALIGNDLRERAGVRYVELGARSLLNHCDTPRMPDSWTINPYRGCSFGCRYCYARYTHGFLGLDDPREFERRIFVKLGAGDALEREVTAARLKLRPIAIGTVTDPYQPAERRYELTRRVLEVLARYRGLRISITTKSALVLRDLDLLRRISDASDLSVHVSLVTVDRSLARRLDPGAPSPARRLVTVRTLASAGIDVGVNAMPVLPAITDSEPSLRCLFRAASRNGASWVMAVPLFLASTTRRHFFAWLRSEMPEHLPLYRRIYGDGIDPDPAWRRRLRARIDRIREETGVAAPPRHPHVRDAGASQLGLPGIGG